MRLVPSFCAVHGKLGMHSIRALKFGIKIQWFDSLFPKPKCVGYVNTASPRYYEVLVQKAGIVISNISLKAEIVCFVCTAAGTMTHLG